MLLQSNERSVSCHTYLASVSTIEYSLAWWMLSLEVELKTVSCLYSIWCTKQVTDSRSWRWISSRPYHRETLWPYSKISRCAFVSVAMHSSRLNTADDATHFHLGIVGKAFYIKWRSGLQYKQVYEFSLQVLLIVVL